MPFVGSACGGEDARSFGQTLLDRLAQRDRHVEAVSDVTDGGEPGQERPLRVGDRTKGIVGGVELEALEVGLGAELRRQMGVHIHQPRHQRGVLEVDDLVAAFRLEVSGNDVGDLPLLHHDGDLFPWRVGDAVDQAGGMDERARGDRNADEK
jgi:hypothetical protein